MTTRKQAILILDDDHEVADTLAYIVGQHGHEVVVAYDGEWALHLASQRKFDVAFFDILLPGINGVECFIKFKQHCPKASVYMMTGYASESLATLALQHGANDVMRKPVMPESILAMLERLSNDAVLVVDDDQDVSASLSSILRKSGWKCEVAPDGETAVKMASVKSYGAMILDLKLPNLSGVEVFSKLQEAGVTIPTLVITGHDKDYPRMTHAAVQGYLQKPADPRVVLAMLEQASRPST